MGATESYTLWEIGLNNTLVLPRLFLSLSAGWHKIFRFVGTSPP